MDLIGYLWIFFVHGIFYKSIIRCFLPWRWLWFPTNCVFVQLYNKILIRQIDKNDEFNWVFMDFVAAHRIFYRSIMRCFLPWRWLWFPTNCVFVQLCSTGHRSMRISCQKPVNALIQYLVGNILLLSANNIEKAFHVWYRRINRTVYYLVSIVCCLNGKLVFPPCVL